MSRQLIEAAGRAADVVAPAGWIFYLTDYLKDFNEVVHFIALLATIFATVASGLYHIRKWREK